MIASTTIAGRADRQNDDLPGFNKLLDAAALWWRATA